jgi:hypothetical protein
MRSPLSMILILALMLALSLPGRAQADEESCVNVSVQVDITVEVDITVNVTLDDDGNVNLDWQTDKEPDTDGFNVYWADPKGPYTQINDDLIQPQGDRGSGDSYTLVDKPGNGKDYYYMLESIDSNGKRKHRALVYVSNP